MQDIQLFDDGKIIFSKRLWAENELLLARCYNFQINHETNEVTAFLITTFKKAIYEFVKLAFRNFSESLNETERRDAFYSKLEDLYIQKDAAAEAIMRSSLPYFDKLYSHQGDTLKQAYFSQFVFGALDMGLGKTLIAASMSRMAKVSRTVIICPAAVKWNWYRDLTSWGYNELFFTLLDSAKRNSIQALNERFVIVNFDILGNFEKYITQSDVGHFIIDESHMLKNHTSQRFKLVMRIVAKFPNAKITFLSGTPVANRVNDVFAYLKLIGHELGLSHSKFLTEYTVKTNTRGGDRVTGGKNLQDLNTKLANFMIRKTKEECLDLPGKIFLSYRFELDDYRDEYDKIIEELSKNKEIRSLTGNLHSLNIITSKAKLPGIKELAESIIETGKKVVIFGSYREPLNQLEEYFGNRCVKIDGSVNSWQRDQHIQRFHNDPECMVFLGNMKAAGVGINLTNASEMIFLNYPFTPSEMDQATDRCDRIGQKNAVNIHLPFCDESIDDYIYEIIIDKRKDINALIDNGKEVVLRENTVEILIKKLLNRNEINIDLHNVEDSELEGYDGSGETSEENLGDDQEENGGSVVSHDMEPGVQEKLEETNDGENNLQNTDTTVSSVYAGSISEIKELGYAYKKLHAKGKSKRGSKNDAGYIPSEIHPEYPAKGYDSTGGMPKLIHAPEPVSDKSKYDGLSFEQMSKLVVGVEDNKSQFIGTFLPDMSNVEPIKMKADSITPFEQAIKETAEKQTGNISQETIDANWAHVAKTREEISNKASFAPGHQITLEEGIAMTEKNVTVTVSADMSVKDYPTTGAYDDLPNFD